MKVSDAVESVDAFLARGGNLKQIAPVKKGVVAPHLRTCKCGCNGNQTDHSMRLGEKGIQTGSRYAY